MKIAFSEEIRNKIDAMPIGREFKMKELARELGVVTANYRQKASRISSMLMEKIASGSLVKLDYGTYKKIATVKTVSKRAWSTVKGCKNQGKPKNRHVEKIPPKMVVYRGVVYPSAKDFCKLFEMSGEQLTGYVERGFYKKLAIFTTKVGAYKTANYYAENFATCEKIRINANDKVDDDEE